MGKFIKLLVLFSMPVLIGIISLELFLRNIPNDYAYKCNYLNEKSDDIEALFLGSSHIYYGINPQYMACESFNGAHVSQSLDFDLVILEKYKDHWNKLKYIIIPVDYFSMYSTLETGIEKWRVKNYNIYYSVNKGNSYWDRFELFSGKFPDHIFRVLEHLGNEKSNIDCSKLGFGLAYNSRNCKDLLKTGEIAAQNHTFNIKNNRCFSENVQTIRSIIDFSRKHNVKLLFVTCPVYNTYRQNLEARQLNNTINVIKQLSSKSINTYYYNFLTDSTFTAHDFYDADHLNEIGAKKLTLKIDSIIKAITPRLARMRWSASRKKLLVSYMQE